MDSTMAKDLISFIYMYQGECQEPYCKIMFVNVCAVVAHSKKDLKITISHYSAASVNFVLTISISKNKVMC